MDVNGISLLSLYHLLIIILLEFPGTRQRFLPEGLFYPNWSTDLSQGVLGVSKRILGFTWDGGGTDIRGIILIFFVVYYWFTLFGQVIFIRKYSVLGVNKKK